jgi:hypothetical protein
MNANLKAAALVAGLVVLTGCGGDEFEGGKGPGHEYEVVAEGSAAGTDPALTSGVPPLTNTNADTTTAFTMVPGDTTSTAVAPMPPVIGTDPTMTGGTYYPPTASGSQSTMPPPRAEPQLDIRRSNPRPSGTTSGSRPATSQPPATATSTAATEQQEPVETPEPAPVEEDDQGEGEEAEEPVTATSTSPG